jgi:transposase
MAKHKRTKSPAEQQLPAQLQAINLHAAGIDVGAEAHWVAVPVEADPQPIQVFPAHTAGLLALLAWLTTCGITTVALESTGVDWIPLFELLETHGVEVILVDPGTIRKMAGQKPTSTTASGGSVCTRSACSPRPSGLTILSSSCGVTCACA